MSEIKQMYLNAYYGEKHFVEPEMPIVEEIQVQDDEHNFKQAYRRAKSGLKKN